MLAAAANSFAQTPAPVPLVVDRIVAVVNKEVVTSSELRERVEPSSSGRCSSG